MSLQLESDAAAGGTRSVYYTISGPGFNQHPTEVFTLDSTTGMLSVHKAVDREEFPSFTVSWTPVARVGPNKKNKNCIAKNFCCAK